MELRTVRRGLVALAMAATLGVAGAHPAAAAETGWFEQSLRWLSGLWAAEYNAATAQPDRGPFDWVASWADKGMGLDPNGETVQEIDPPGQNR